MKAYVIRQFGEPEVFGAAELPRPEVIPGHVLIRVAATSVNPVDYKIRRGSPAAPAFPAVLHGDVAGVVEEVGSGVTSFRPGDEVYGCAGGFRGMGGALAECMLADAALLAHKPSSLSMAEAAALPLVAITAYEGLFDRARLRPGQTVLVHGGAGGVGHVALQLAKAGGARVVATVSSEAKAALVRSLGADEVVNYRTETVPEYVQKYTDGKGFDLVFDSVGKENLARSFEAAANFGSVVSIMTYGAPDLTPLHAKALSLHAVYQPLPLLTGVGRARHGEILTEVAKLADQGQLKPVLDERRFHISEVAEAHRLLESGGAIGKIVLTWQ